MSERILRVERIGTHARVIVDRPDVRNAFNAVLIAELHAAFDVLGSDPQVRCIVLEGAGPTFSGGADIAWMRAALDLDEAGNIRDAATMASMFRTIDRCPKPVIARVQGAALGGGCGLVAVADIAIAAENAVFGFTEVRLGLVPGVISPYVLAKIGVSHARALMVTGERFDAPHAQRIGLVHQVVPESELDARVAAVVTALAGTGPHAVAAVKELIAHVADADASVVEAVTTAAIAKRRVSAEGQEGLRAFLERRPPSWSA